MSMKNRVWITTAVGIASLSLAYVLAASAIEGMYLAIPAIALAWYLTDCDTLRQTWQARLRPALTYAIGILLIGVGICSLIFGAAALVSWRFWWEISAALYLFGSLLFLLLSVRRLMKLPGEYCCQHWKIPRATQWFLCELMPMGLFLMLALPYGMAFSQVYRFKIPNTNNPKLGLEREFEDVEFTSADGTRLRGWWIPGKQSTSRTLVFCHGIGANRSMFLRFALLGDHLNANVLMFDLRGHGESGGRGTSLGHHESRDALAAIAWVRREKPNEAKQVVGMGVSLGAATMALAAAAVEPPLDGVILDSSFTSTYEMSAQVLRNFPSLSHPWLLTLGMPMADLHASCPMTAVSPEVSIHRLRAPVLFLHSQGDPLIPVEHSRRLHARAAEPKTLCVFDLDRHCAGYFAASEAYIEAVGKLRDQLPSE